MNTSSDVQSHYTRAKLAETIIDGLRRAGLDGVRLTPEALAPADEFHIRGLEGTEAFARLVGLKPGMRLLDVGCGIGGPARYAAHAFGVSVVGIDLTPEFVATARMLTDRTELSHRVSFEEGDAMALPLADASVDAAWTIHALMNVPDKHRVARELARVVRPGGFTAHYEILRGPAGDPYYPAPWARDPSISFLVTPEAFRRTLEDAPFAIETWEDVTPASLAWVQGLPTPAEPGPLGLHLLLGAEAPVMLRNVQRGLEEHRLSVAMVVGRRK